ncbi:MAG: transposase [Ruthenibacterium lactatiformans]
MKYRKNSVPGKQRGKKYSEAVRTACMCDLLVVDNLSDVAKKHGVPESTLRTWKAKAEKLGPEGEKSLWAQARDEQVKQIALKAAQGARLGTALIVHRLEAGQRNMQRCDEIDRILLGSEKSEGLVLWGDTAVDEQRQRTKLGRELEERLRDERQQRGRIIPGGFCAGEYDADAYQRIRKGRGRAGRGAGRRETV